MSVEKFKNFMMYFNIDFINGNNKSRVLKFTV